MLEHRDTQLRRWAIDEAVVDAFDEPTKPFAIHIHLMLVECMIEKGNATRPRTLIA